MPTIVDTERASNNVGTSREDSYQINESGSLDDNLLFNFDNSQADDIPKLFVITASLDPKITSDENAYVSLVNALISLHKDPNLISPDDFVLYNIGSPLLRTTLRSDNQRNIFAFDKLYDQLFDYLTELRGRSATHQILSNARDLKIDYENEIEDKQKADRVMIKQRCTFSLTQLLVHLALIIYYASVIWQVTRQETCLSMYGSIKPYIVYPKDSEGYKN